MTASIPISSLPTASSPLTGTELVPLVQNGSTVQGTVSEIVAAVPSIGITTINISANTSASIGKSYGVKTSSGAYTVTLPSASVGEGSTIWVLDVDNNAAVNNITVAAAVSQNINYYSSQSSSLVLNTNSSGIMLIVRNGAWRALPLTGL